MPTRQMVCNFIQFFLITKKLIFKHKNIHQSTINYNILLKLVAFNHFGLLYLYLKPDFLFQKMQNMRQ
jgi:hypothetical protein